MTTVNRLLPAPDLTGPAVNDEHFVVVGVDGSAAATGAATWAAAEAQRRGVALHIVHAFAPPAIGFDGHTGAVAAQEDARAQAATTLALARNAVLASFPGLAVSTRQQEDSPVAVLRAASRSAVLTVVGSRGKHQLTEALLGSVAARVSEDAYGPVVVIRADADQVRVVDGGPVVVGLDGSPDSEHALKFAFDEAAMRRVPLIALRAWDTGALDGFLGVYPLLIDPQSVDEQERQALALQLEPWQAKYPEVTVRPLVRRGTPSAALLRFGDGADRSGQLPSLIVVGSRGRGALAGTVMGSTSRALIAHAVCGVAVVRLAG